MRLKQVIEVSHGIIGRLTSLTSIFSCFIGYDWYFWKKRTTCSEMSLLRRGHTHQKRSSRAQICSMPLQLLTYLQKHQRPHRMSSTQLPACHQLSPVRATPTAHAHRAGHVPSHLRSLSWQFSGKSYRLKKSSNRMGYHCTWQHILQFDEFFRVKSNSLKIIEFQNFSFSFSLTHSIMHWHDVRTVAKYPLSVAIMPATDAYYSCFYSS